MVRKEVPVRTPPPCRGLAQDKNQERSRCKGNSLSGTLSFEMPGQELCKAIWEPFLVKSKGNIGVQAPLLGALTTGVIFQDQALLRDTVS